MEPEATPATTPSTDEPPAAPAAAETSEPLPDGWETAVSPVDGRAYFYNPTTGATSWTHPSLPATNPEPTPDIQDVPSIGDFSGIIANRTVEDYGDKTADVEAGMYTKMTDYDPKQPIHTHRCYAVIATILFLPLGAIALCKSFSCAKKWKQELYEKAHDDSRKALLFSRISCIIGVLFWSYFAYCFFMGPAGPGVVEIPQEWIDGVADRWHETFHSRRTHLQNT